MSRESRIRRADKVPAYEQQSLVEYLFTSSDPSLRRFELAHLNLAANFRKDFIAFLDMLVDELAEARAARMIREGRAGQDEAGVVFLALAALVAQHEARKGLPC